ncbi:hypothetical protein CFSAN002369_20068 [Clostridium botulinum CFSAN002369]|nr:hypothetical protein CFSAN002369_20068 [Clostridium botulinum CFSAN002369]
MRNGFVFSLVMALIVAIFAIQNAVAIPIKILFWQINFFFSNYNLIFSCYRSSYYRYYGYKKERGIKNKIKIF